MIQLQIPPHRAQRNDIILKKRLSPTSNSELSANLSSTRTDSFQKANKTTFPKKPVSKSINHKSHLILPSSSGPALNSPRSFRDATPKPEKVIGSISDFFNKKQISTAVQTSNTVPNRIKMIDMIIERRAELKKLEGQLREDRAKPLISKLQQNFRKRRLKKMLEQNKKNAEHDTMIRPDIDELHFRRESLEFLDVVAMTKTFGSASNLTKQSIEGSNNPSNSEIQAEAVGTLDALDQNTKHDQNFEKFSEKVKMFVFRRTKADKGDKTLVQSPKHLTTPQLPTKKTIRHEKSVGNLSLEEYHLASKTLKKDLFKFVMKQKAQCDSDRTNGFDEDSRNIFFHSATKTNGKLKDIEGEVERKVETYKMEHRHLRQRHYLKPDFRVGTTSAKTRFSPLNMTEIPPHIITPSKPRTKPMGLDRSLPTQGAERGSNKRITMLLTEDIDEFKLYLSSQK